MEQLGQRHHRAGRIFRALQDQRTAGADGRDHLADRLVEGEVPRRKGSAHPNRLAHHDLAHIGLARRDHAAVDAAAFLGMPFGVLGADHDFADGFGQRLALVQRDVAADLLGALAGQFRHAAQDLGALQRRGLLPAFKGALRGGESAVQIAAVGMRQLAQQFLGGGVDDVLLASIPSLDEFPVDVEGEILVHAFLLQKVACDKRSRCRRGGGCRAWARWPNRKLNASAGFVHRRALVCQDGRRVLDK